MLRVHSSKARNNDIVDVYILDPAEGDQEVEHDYNLQVAVDWR